MAVKDLTSTQVAALVGGRDGRTGHLVPPVGYADAYNWIMQALDHVGAAAFGNLMVRADDASDTTVRIFAGRATIVATLLTYAGGTIDLAAHNNDTAYVWLYDNAGTATIGYGADGSGWPSIPHIKLASVTLSAGAITAIVDRRHERVLRDAAVMLEVYSNSTRPAAGKVGRVIFNTDDAAPNFDDGTDWRDAAGATT